ncbi:MAG: serine/threonine-protein kinase, partial [Planctomycetota bacterium]
MSDDQQDNFRTLFPDPNEKAQQTLRPEFTSPEKLPTGEPKPAEPAPVSKTLAWSGPLFEVGNVDETGRRIIDLLIVRKEQWDAAVQKVGGSADLHAVLRALADMPSGRFIPGENELPALTEFQIQQIMNGNADRLRIGYHLILDRIGAGGMGEVFKVWNTNLQRPEAIKTVLSEHTVGATASSTHARDRFEREARVLAQLDHPYITTIYQFGRDHDVDFLAMEYVHGQDMKAIVEEARLAGDQVPVWWACERISATAEALQHAHEKGVIHRDIKPSNIMITDNDELKVLDMGIARLTSPRGGDHGMTRLTQAAVGLGTPEVMSPEQWADATAVTPESDIYSLGCTFFYVLTGQMPFKADNLNALMFAHVNDPPPAASSLRPDIPKELDSIICKMLAKEPADRYRSCSELIAALAPFVQHEPEGGNAGRSGSSKWIAAVAGLVGVLTVLAVLVLKPDLLQKEKPVTKPKVDWLQRSKDWLTTHQFEHKDVWPTATAIDHWLVGAARTLESEAEFESLKAKVSTETRARLEQKKKNEALTASLRETNAMVWPDAKSLESALASAVTPDEFCDPSKADVFASKLKELTNKRWQAKAEEQLADFQSKHTNTWASRDMLIEYAADQKMPVTSIDSDAKLRELLDTINRKTWERTTQDWVREYQGNHQKIWTQSDLLAFIHEQTSGRGVLNDAENEKMQNAVRTESKKLIQDWVDNWLTTYQSEAKTVWPDAEEFHKQAEILRGNDRLDDDESLNRYTGKVVELTQALENPFAHLKLPNTGDPVTDASIATLLKTYELLLAAQSGGVEEGSKFQFDVILRDTGEVVEEVEVKTPFQYQVSSSEPGYVTSLIFQEGQQNLVLWPVALEPGQPTKAFTGVANTPGSDRIITFLTDKSIADQLDMLPEGIIKRKAPGNLKELWLFIFADPSLMPASPVANLDLVKHAFSHPQVYER